MTTIGSLRVILIIAGMILAIVGLVMNNWKLAVIGDTIAIGGSLFA